MAAREEKLRIIKRDLESRINELNALSEISRLITSSDNLNKMLGFIAKKITAMVKADICMVHLLNKGAFTPKMVYGAMRDRDTALKLAHVLSKSKLASRVLRTERIQIVDNLIRHKKDPFCGFCARESMQSLLMAPLVERGTVLGTLPCCSKRPYAYTKDDEEEILLFANQAAMAVENARLFDNIKVNYLNTMKLVAGIIDSKDRYTESHSEQVMRTALGIASILNLSVKQKTIIRYASLLHDIGKVGIDTTILRKTGPLTREEWVEMMRHPKVGAEIIKKAGFLDELIPSILYHHVRYSGGGYPPTRKRREAIPIEARIMAVADAYEAMRSKRPYRKRLSRESAVSELKRNSGTQFDPKVVNALLKVLR